MCFLTKIMSLMDNSGQGTTKPRPMPVHLWLEKNNNFGKQEESGFSDGRQARKPLIDRRPRLGSFSGTKFGLREAEWREVRR